MYKARGDFLWSQTSLLAALEYNMNRGSKTRPVRPDAFNPFAKKVESDVVIRGKESWAALKNLVTSKNTTTKNVKRA